MRLLLPLCAALLAVTAQPSSSQQVNMPPAERDRWRRDLPNIISVVRSPTRAESTWVALVRQDSPDTSALVRFNRAAPYWVTWLLGNTRRSRT